MLLSNETCAIQEKENKKVETEGQLGKRKRKRRLITGKKLLLL